MTRAFAQSRVVLIVILISVVLLSGCGGSSGSGSASSTLAASFSVSENSSTTLNFTVFFDASASGGNIQNYRWNFGDGTGWSAGKSIAHTFQDYGDFQVTLIVNNENGIVDQDVLDGITDVSLDPDIDKATQNIAVGFSLSGVVTAQPGSIVDSDTNDPLAPFASNDSRSTAQAISNPAIVGGFASLIGTGNSGDRFGTTGDISDWYRVTLSVNQTITLSVSDDPKKNDLDLFLYSATPGMQDRDRSSETINPVESIIVPADGDYYIAVEAWEGISNYVLSVGDTTVLNTSNRVSTADEFVPGDVIVIFREDVPSASGGLVSGVIGLQSRAALIGMQAKSGGPGRPMLFGLGDEKQKQQAFSVLGIQVSGSRQSSGKQVDVRQQLKDDTVSAVKALRQRPDVLAADLNYIRRPLAITPDDTGYANQWHYPLINLPAAWDEVVTDSMTRTHGDVVVAVVDTGVFLNHPDLNDNLVPGYDFVSSLDNAGDGNGRDPDPNDPGDNSGPNGVSSFHGTHVAGTIAAESDNNAAVPGGVAGVAWNTDTKIMPIRVLGTQGGTSFDVIAGVSYAAGLDNAVETQQETAARVAAGNVADILNLSFGGESPSQSEQIVYDQIRAQGVIVIAAAGNGGSNSLSYPASYNSVVSVSAVDRFKTVTWYSNFGQFVDVAAPGGGTLTDADGVYSTTANDSGIAGYRYLSGTSMAAPHVAGVVALMKSVYPQLTPSEFDILLLAGVLTQDLGEAGRDDQYGYGLIDAQKAVQQAVSLRETSILPSYIALSANSFRFLEPDTSFTLTVSNPGGGSVTLDSVIGNAPWLTVSPVDVDADNLGVHRVTINRNGLANGQYQSVITLDYSGDTIGTVTIPVTMQVGAVSSTGDIGHLYGFVLDFDVLLSGFGNPVVGSSIMGSSSTGEYDYLVRGIGPGNYLIFATSNLDNDFIICDPGEGCGLYPSVVTIPAQGQNKSGLNFSSRFDGGIDTAILSVKPEKFSIKK